MVIFGMKTEQNKNNIIGSSNKFHFGCNNLFNIVHKFTLTDNIGIVQNPLSCRCLNRCVKGFNWVHQNGILVGYFPFYLKVPKCEIFDPFFLHQ